MKNEIKKKWVRKLRAWRHRKCNGLLAFGEQRCALGILCEVIDPQQRLSKWKRRSMIPVRILRATGLDKTDADQVAKLNDGYASNVSIVRACNFSEIADWIEENIK